MSGALGIISPESQAKIDVIARLGFTGHFNCQEGKFTAKAFAAKGMRHITTVRADSLDEAVEAVFDAVLAQGFNCPSCGGAK